MFNIMDQESNHPIVYNNENTIIFTIARMNPPTPGHLFLIQSLILEAIGKKVSEVYVILSKTNDNKEDPIKCSEKVTVLGNDEVDLDTETTMINALKKKMMSDPLITSDLQSDIQKMEVIIRCVPQDIKGATPFTPLVDILKAKSLADNKINLIFLIGDDRKNMLDSISDYFLKWENVYSINGKILPREEMSEYKNKSKDPQSLESLVMSEVPVNAMSASFVRNIVKNKNRQKFKDLYSPYLDDDRIDILYQAIMTGIETLKDVKKKDVPVKPMKYTYPRIKGGYRYRRRTRKSVVNKRKKSRKKNKFTKKG